MAKSELWISRQNMTFPNRILWWILITIGEWHKPIISSADVQVGEKVGKANFFNTNLSDPCDFEVAPFQKGVTFAITL